MAKLNLGYIVLHQLWSSKYYTEKIPVFVAGFVISGEVLRFCFLHIPFLDVHHILSWSCAYHPGVLGMMTEKQ